MANQNAAPQYAQENENMQTAEAQRPPSTRRDDASDGSLFEQQDAQQFQQRWNQLQAGFVDDPRSAVEGADDLVAEVMKRITATFEAQRMLLERQWGQGEQASTEDLRVALQRYRSFFQRLLSF